MLSLKGMKDKYEQFFFVKKIHTPLHSRKFFRRKFLIKYDSNENAMFNLFVQELNVAIVLKTIKRNQSFKLG